MYFGCSQCILLAALVTTVHATIMVKLVDGSFVPWSFGRRDDDDDAYPLALTNHNDMSYLTTVLMGTPFQQVAMSPSLSQNFIAVATAPIGVSSSSYYNAASSSSYIPGNAVASITSISGQTVTGPFAGETCALQATDADTFGYNASIVLTNSSVSNDLYPIGARGILGYGINAPTNSPANASLIPVFLPSDFTSAICGIELNHMDDPVPDGILTMGGIDSTAFTGNFTNAMVPANSLTSWAVPVDTITYLSNGVNTSLPGLVASVDLYHSVIQLTSQMAAQLYAGIPESQAVSNDAWSIPCNSKFPITLTFGGVPFTIEERDTVVKLSNGTCQGVVTGGAQQVGKVGAPFMRNFYTQFGAQKNSNGSLTAFVGFAKKIVRTTPSTVTTTVISPTTVTTTGPKQTGSTNGASGIAVRDALLFSALAIASIIALVL